MTRLKDETTRAKNLLRVEKWCIRVFHLHLVYILLSFYLNHRIWLFVQYDDTVASQYAYWMKQALIHYNGVLAASISLLVLGMFGLSLIHKWCDPKHPDVEPGLLYLRTYITIPVVMILFEFVVAFIRALGSL